METTKYLMVKNWESFQHYKERNPPWIKLHRDLLRDYDFLCLQDASKMQLILIWLLASQMNNKIPADANFIKTQIGIKGDLNLKELIDKGFLIDASNALAKRKQVAIVETETETETETEKDIFVFPDCIPKKEWEDFKAHRGKKFTKKAQELALLKLEAWHKQGYDIKSILENSVMNGWSGLFLPKDAPKVNKKWSPF